MKILTAVVNNPIFIEIQFYTLQKYFKGDYEFIVFNDAKDFPDFTNGGDINLKSQIKETCRRLNIECIDIPNLGHQHIKDPSTRTADSMNYILHYQKEHPDQYLVIDSDMFLIDDFDISKYSSYSCALLHQSRLDNKIHYCWNGIYYFDTTRMKQMELLNWDCSPHCDTGGMMQEWLGKQRLENGEYSDDIYFMKHLSSGRWTLRDLPVSLQENTKLVDFLKTDPRNEKEQVFCELYDNVFLHYRCGGNWRQEGLDLHKKLSEKLRLSLV
jgi:hypothetical protein